jgi:aminopeptidase N
VFRDSQFSSDMNSAAVKRIENVNMLRAVQFAEDSGPLAHAVRPRSYLEISNFYTATIYEKGAEVVRMLHTCLGPAHFRAGSDLYFERHDGSAATTEDFVQAMESASGEDFSRFRQWYEQAGTPELTVTSNWQNGKLTLTIAQDIPATPGQPDKGPTHIPVVLALLGPNGVPLALDNLQIECDASARVEQRDAEVILHVLEAKSRLVIQGLVAEPQVSFLRGFSAPVRVRWSRPDSTLRFLAEHDTDGFARWDVLQSLLVAEVVRLGEIGTAVGSGSGPVLDADLLALMDSLIEQTLVADRAAEPLGIMAEMLSLPSELYLFEQVDKIDVEALCGGRQRLQQQLGEQLHARWQALYSANSSSSPYEPSPVAMVTRRLRNLALSYLCAAGRDETDRLLAHYRDADNLTDRRAALVEIANAPWLETKQRASLLEGFYERWQDQALVVNQWLGIMASNHLATAADVALLEAHPSYDQRNPNKVRGLLGGFSQANQRNFHAADGSGYAYLARKIIQLNASNPQVAARCAQPLTRWRRYTEARGARMRAALESIAVAPDLSKDVYEIVNKGLSD